MKQKILFFMLCVITITGYSQFAIGPQKTIGGNSDDELGQLCLTSDGGMVLGGRSYSYISGEKTEYNRGADDYWVIKLNKAGNIQWQRTLGGTDIDEIISLQQTKDGGYILAGNSLSSPSGDKADNKGVFDYWVVKLNSFGSVEWQKTLGGDSYEFCSSVQQTKDGGYLIGGSSLSNISGDKSENSDGGYDYWIAKLDKNGNKLWDKTIGGSGDEFLAKVIETTDGGYFLGGISISNISGDKSEDSRGQNDFWAVKLDKNRNKIWDKTAGGNDNDYVNGLVQTPDGGYVLSGSSASNISGEKTSNSRGAFDFWLVKFSKTGAVQWDKTMGGSDYEFEATVDNTSDGGLIVGGNSASNISGEKSENSRGSYDYWVIKLDSKGKISWDKTIGGDGDENLKTIIQTSDNKYVIGGFSPSDISGEKIEASRGGFDYWVVTLISKDEAFSSNNVANQATDLSKLNTSFSAYPNPAKNIVNIYSNTKANYTLIDQAGKALLNKQIEGNGTLDVSSFATGFYFIKNNATGLTKRILIVK